MATRNNKTEPATMLTLARETRQHILQYAFADASSKDYRLNLLLQLMPYSSKYMGHLSLPCAPNSLNDIVAPQIYNLTVALASAVPTVIDDIKFVLTKELRILEQRRYELLYLVLDPGDKIWDRECRRWLQMMNRPEVNLTKLWIGVMSRMTRGQKNRYKRSDRLLFETASTIA